MTVRVGIPRALFFYHYYPLWQAFFEALGVECVVSAPTHRGILEVGATRATGENCLPLKIYLGHVRALLGRVDYLFTPLIRTLAYEEENCARLRGLPDLVRALIPEAPPILAPEIDVEGGTWKLTSAVLDLGLHFTRNPLRIRKAVEQAQVAHRTYETMLQRSIPLPEALSLLSAGKFGPLEDTIEWSGKTGGPDNSNRATFADSDDLEEPLRIALVGHAYNLYDEYVNHRLIARLQALGVALSTSAAVSEETARESIARLDLKHYWTFEHELVGAAAYYLGQEQVDGMIVVVSFACGPDAVMLETLQGLSSRFNVPLLNLVLDEHSGEAGLVTRIEAFVDVLARRKTLGGAVRQFRALA